MNSITNCVYYSWECGVSQEKFFLGKGRIIRRIPSLFHEHRQRRPGGLLRGDIPFPGHEHEHRSHALFRFRRVIDGIVRGRRLRQTREESAFREGQVFRRFVEIDARRVAYTVSAVTEVNRIEINFKDLFFRVVPL